MNYSSLDQAIRRHRLAWRLLLYAAQHDLQAQPRFGRPLLSIWSQEYGAAAWICDHPFPLPDDRQPAKSELCQIFQMLAPFASALLRLAQLPSFGELAPFRLACQSWRRPPGKKAVERAQLELEQRIAGLRRWAVECLLGETEFSWVDGGYDSFIESFARMPSLDVDLNLYAYGLTLNSNHRAAFRGTEAHVLWLMLPDTLRCELSATLVFAARDRLFVALESYADTLTAPPAA